MSNPSRDDQLATTETIYDEPSSSNHTNDSAAYAENHVTEDLHPAFAEAGIGFDTSNDCFAAKCDEVYDETALIDSEKAFTDALEQFQQGVKPKYKSQIDLRETHSWDEVMQYANEARDKYTGVDKKGIAKKINNRLRTFQTAAPGIQAWLKLLPSTSTYGSVVCGGFTIILEVASGTPILLLRQLTSNRQLSASDSSEKRPSMLLTKYLSVSRRLSSSCGFMATRKSTNKWLLCTLLF